MCVGMLCVQHNDHPFAKSISCVWQACNAAQGCAFLLTWATAAVSIQCTPHTSPVVLMICCLTSPACAQVQSAIQEAAGRSGSNGTPATASMPAVLAEGAEVSILNVRFRAAAEPSLKGGWGVLYLCACTLWPTFTLLTTAEIVKAAQCMVPCAV
jgi:hypothetical protein